MIYHPLRNRPIAPALSADKEIGIRIFSPASQINYDELLGIRMQVKIL